jgi:hypothetical protein
MAYLLLDDLKTYLGIGGDAENAILTDLLAAAEAAINAYCDRVFAASSDTTRTFTAAHDAEGARLYLDTDLCQVTSIVNGNPAGSTIAPADYAFLPSDPPYHSILLRPTALVVWEGDITITGRWAYSIAPPVSIVQATREYAGHLYHIADQQAVHSNRPTLAMPEHIQQLLASYRRLR